MNRALPGAIIDLIRDGVPERELRRRGTESAVRRALIRTAASAYQRGWTRAEWTDEVDRLANLLSRQVRLAPNGTEHTRRYVEHAYRSAWDVAARWISEDAAPAFDRASALARVEGIAQAADGADLSDRDRAVLTYALDHGRSVGTDRPAMALRAVAERTGLGVKAVRLALASLVQRGWLRLEVRGRADPRAGRASLYRLTVPAGTHIPTGDVVCVPGHPYVCPPPEPTDNVIHLRRWTAEQEITESPGAAATLTAGSGRPRRLTSEGA